ncbi:MAG: calcium/sodium antiporter [Sedimentisphaerales bacterium]|nr:calcium/sodium antiporter [Sedimentisphaerales bacterium]
MIVYFLMVAGFAAVVGGAEFLIRGASGLARRLRVSDLVIGLTVVAFGTSLPELFVNLTASINGDEGIAVGNIVGSNIANILLILGISALIAPLSVTPGTVWKEIPLSLLAAVLLLVMANDRLIDGGASMVLGRADGIILISFFVVFVYYSFGIARAGGAIRDVQGGPAMSGWRIGGGICTGLVCLIVGSRWVVNGAVVLAGRLGVSQTVIGLTIVAVGTSLPELATSAAAAYRGNADLAVGNVVGSNIFNIFFILGASAVIRPLPFTSEQNVDTTVLIAASLLLLVFMLTGGRRRLDRWEGVVSILLYIGYLAFLVFRAARGGLY